MFVQYDKKKSAKAERLYDKYGKVLLREALYILHDHGEAEDAVQQVFVKIRFCIDKIKEDEPGMTCNFLKVVVRNIAKDMHRKRMLVSIDEDCAPYVEDKAPGKITETSQIVIQNESYDRIMKAIMSLPEIYRDVLLIEKVYGYSREESMKLLNANYETLKKRMTRAKSKLLEVLKEEGIDDGRAKDRKYIR